jgi:hypothetical protein
MEVCLINFNKGEDHEDGSFDHGSKKGIQAVPDLPIDSID